MVDPAEKFLMSCHPVAAGAAAIPFPSGAVERSAATEGRRKRQEARLMTIRLITSLKKDRK